MDSLPLVTSVTFKLYLSSSRKTSKISTPEISSPNLDRMFMAVKTCLKNFVLIFKNNKAAIANCLKISICSKSESITASFIRE